MTLEVDGWEKVDLIHKRIKLKKGQVTAGYSGSPVLNEGTWKVCGIMKATRDKQSDLGGWAIPVEILSSELQNLIESNIDFHTKNHKWEEAIKSQVELLKEGEQGQPHTKFNDDKVNNIYILL